MVHGDESDMPAPGDVEGIPLRSAREVLGIALDAKADDGIRPFQLLVSRDVLRNELLRV